MSVKAFTGELVFSTLKQAVLSVAPSPSDTDETLGERIIPRDLRQWLARLRLLEGVPFAYLVADSALLPPESIRYFYVDRNWTDALIQGALSVGTVNSADRAQLEQLHRELRDEIDEEERLVRMPGGERAQQGPAGTITGLLLRSRAVSGWPGLHVRAYRRDVVQDDEIVPESHPDRVKLLRLERLAPAVLLALFDGVPAVVQIEEPRQGVQFGVRLASAGNVNQFSAQVIARDATTSKDVVPERQMKVVFRPGAPGVLDLRRTAEAFIATPGTHMGPAVDGAEFALQMLRFPYRQVFGDPALGDALDAVFRPSIALDELKLRIERGLG
jgi:hypothetical protein